MKIDKTGLLYGERIGACSDEAQLHYPRLLVSSNCLGRIEMSYSKIVDTVYASLKTKPSKADVTKWFREYHANHLLFVYKAQDGSVWGQWEVPQRYLPQHPRAESFRSPEPPHGELEAFRRAYVESRKALFDHDDAIVVTDAAPYASIKNNMEPYVNIGGSGSGSGRGSGKGIGIGIGIGKDVGSEPSGSLPAVANLPTNKTD